MIAEKENQRVASQAVTIEFVQYDAGRLVETKEHRQEDTAVQIGNVRETLQVFAPRLHRTMHGVERGQQEKRAIAMAPNEIGRLARDDVRQILVLGRGRAAAQQGLPEPTATADALRQEVLRGMRANGHQLLPASARARDDPSQGP